MLKLICGGAGTGKSSLLYKKASEAAQSGKKVILFVPDQFSFEAEKIIYRTVPHEYSRYCRVTMFSREAQKILREHGQTKEYADDISKRIVMKGVLGRLKGSLLHYGDLAGKRDFVAFALKMVSELRGAGLSVSELRKRLSAEDILSPALTDKMNDILMIYEAYDTQLKTAFDDKLDDIRRAAELILDSGDGNIFEGCDVFFDEFDRFSGNQLMFVKALIEKADSVTAALTYRYPESGNEPDDPKYSAVRKLIGQLSEVSRPAAEDITKLYESYRKPGIPRIIEARDIWQECDWICAEICSLMESGVRCRDIAVLTPAPCYAPVLDSALRKYGIPAFADIPETLMSKSFVKFAVCALRALTFETNDILRYVKSGFVRYDITDPDSGKTQSVLLQSRDINRLERICRKYDLRERDWHKPFPEGIDKDGRLEEIRQTVIKPLEALKKAVTDSDGASVTRSLCVFLTETMHIEKTIRGKCYRADGGFDSDRFDEYDSLWEDAVTVFESAYKALGGHIMPLEEYISLLTDAFTSVTVARPPEFLDSVTVGDTDRSRFGDKDYVFLCGFNSGIMPPPARVPQAFSASESEMLADIGIPIAADRESRYASELFTVYRCTNIPKKRLYMTYPLQGSGGELLEPSPSLRIYAADAGITTEGADSFGAAHYCRTVRSAEQYLAHIYRDTAHLADKISLKNMPELTKEYKRMLGSAAGEDPERDRQKIPPQTAVPLISMDAYSPTAIEQLVKCKFAFFCKYGLGLREENARETSAALTGNVVHYCLEQLMKEPDFIDMSRERIVAGTDRSIVKYECETFFEDFGGSKRFSYILKNLSKYAVQAALRIQEEMRVSQFRPIEFEKDLYLDLGGIKVRGRCDRIDGMNSTDGRSYVRVVDYKHSSSLRFDLNEVYRGHNLQMLLYLFGVCDDPRVLSPAAKGFFNNGAAVLDPSSVIYFKFGELPYNESEDDESEKESKALKSRRDYYTGNSSQGLVVSGSPEIAEMESRIAALTDELYTRRPKAAEPVGERRFFKGFINSVEVSRGEYDAIRGHCRSFLNARAAEMTAGMTSACPSDDDACAYCSYKLFCGVKGAG